MNKHKSKSDDILSLSSTTPSDDDYNNRYIKSLVNHNNPLSQLHTKSKLKNVNKQFIKKIDMTTLQHKFPKAPKSPKSTKSPTSINHNYMPDYKSSWFTTENNLSLELYIKHLFDLVKLNLQCNLNKNTTKAILVPHEGIYYSGLCAASAYYELLNSRGDFKKNKIDYRKMVETMIHNSIYDQINMNSFNFVNAAFDNVLLRKPSINEFNRAYDIIQKNTSQSLFGRWASNKSEFCQVLTESDAFHEGQIRWFYYVMVQREPSTAEVSKLFFPFIKNHRIEEIIETILITDEYAQFE